MQEIGHEQAAELYFHTPGAGSRKSISYRRFDKLIEAAAYVMENVSPRDRHSCFLEYDEQRFGYDDIRKLYLELSSDRQNAEKT